MVIENCRLDKVPSTYFVPDLDDLTLQTVIYAALPWAKGFHVVEKSGQKAQGAVTFDNICHTVGNTFDDFKAPARGKDGYVEIRNFTRNTEFWKDDQFYLYKNVSHWMKMHDWDVGLVKNFGALHGLALAADQIRNDDESKPRLREDIDVYLRAIFYHINRERGEKVYGAEALANALATVTPIPVRVPKNPETGDGEIRRYVDVIEVLTALGDRAEASGDIATVEFIKVIRANVYFRRAKKDRSYRDWRAAQEIFEDVDTDKLESRQWQVADAILHAFKSDNAYCSGNEYLDVNSLSCEPCPAGKIKTQDGKGCGTCEDGYRPDEDVGTCWQILTQKICAKQSPTRDYDTRSDRCIDTQNSCARQKPPRPFNSDDGACGAPCAAGKVPSGDKCVKSDDDSDEETPL